MKLNYNILHNNTLNIDKTNAIETNIKNTVLNQQDNNTFNKQFSISSDWIPLQIVEIDEHFVAFWSYTFDKMDIRYLPFLQVNVLYKFNDRRPYPKDELRWPGEGREGGIGRLEFYVSAWKDFIDTTFQIIDLDENPYYKKVILVTSAVMPIRYNDIKIDEWLTERVYLPYDVKFVCNYVPVRQYQ